MRIPPPPGMTPRKLLCIFSLLASIAGCAGQSAPPAAPPVPTPDAELCRSVVRSSRLHSYEDVTAAAPGAHAACMRLCAAEDAEACRIAGDFDDGGLGGTPHAVTPADHEEAARMYASACHLGSDKGCARRRDAADRVCAAHLADDAGCTAAVTGLLADADTGGKDGARAHDRAARLAFALCDRASERCESVGAGFAERCAASAPDEASCTEYARIARTRCERAGTGACLSATGPLDAACAHGAEKACKSAAELREGDAVRACATPSGCQASCDTGNLVTCLKLAESYVERRPDDPPGGRYDPQREDQAAAVYQKVCDATDGHLGCYELADLVGPACSGPSRIDAEGLYLCTEPHPVTPAHMDLWARSLIRACDAAIAGPRGQFDMDACVELVRHAEDGPRFPPVVAEARRLCREHALPRHLCEK